MPLPYAAGAPDFKAAGFIPTIFSSQVNVKYYFETLLPRITNTKYSADLKQKGDTVIIPQRPTITWKDSKVAEESDPTIPSSAPVEFDLQRLLTFDFVIPDVLDKQSGLNVGQESTTDATMSMDGEIQSRFFADVYKYADPANQGATAGKQSQYYNMGTAASPIAVNSASALKFITSFRSILAEQKAARDGMWIVIPEVLRYKLMNSALYKAMDMGDAKSILRTGLIGSIDQCQIFSTPQLYTQTVGGNMVFAVIGGNMDAITYFAQMNKAETLRYHKYMGDRYRGTVIYDWKVIKPEALVAAFIYISADS